MPTFHLDLCLCIGIYAVWGKSLILINLMSLWESGAHNIFKDVWERLLGATRDHARFYNGQYYALQRGILS